MQKLLTCLSCGLGLLVTACGGGQTGDEGSLPAPPWTQAGAMDACAVGEYEVLASLDAQAPTGFSASEVLALFEGRMTLPLHWRSSVEAGQDTLAVDTEPTDAALELELAHQGGQVRYRPGQAGCTGKLELDVELALRTPSGALSEAVAATVIASSPREAGIELRFREQRELSAPLHLDGAVSPIHPLQGSLTASARGAQGERYRMTGLAMYLRASELGVVGVLRAWMAAPDAGFEATLATLGDSCDGGFGFALADDRALPSVGASAAATVALLNALSIEAEAGDGSAIPMAIDFAFSPGSACALTGLTLELSADMAIDVSAPGVEIRGHWPVRVRAPGYDVSRPDVEIELTDGVVDELERLESTWGVRGLTLSSYDRAYVTLLLEVHDTREQPRVSGELSVTALQVPADRPVSSADGDVLLHLGLRTAQ